MAISQMPALCVPTSTLRIGSDVWAEAGLNVIRAATKVQAKMIERLHLRWFMV
jgi:hypothetical protein